MRMNQLVNELNAFQKADENPIVLSGRGKELVKVSYSGPDNTVVLVFDEVIEVELSIPPVGESLIPSDDVISDEFGEQPPIHDLQDNDNKSVPNDETLESGKAPFQKESPQFNEDQKQVPFQLNLPDGKG